MTQPVYRTPLLQNFRAGLGEIIDIVKPGIEKLVDVETKKIDLFPPAAQAEIYSRFLASFNKGAKEPIKEGIALLNENQETGILCDIIFEVSTDIGIANNVLSDESHLDEALSKSGFSNASLKLIEKEVGQTLNLAKQKSQIVNAVRKIFGHMDFPVNKAPSRKNSDSFTSSMVSSKASMANGEKSGATNGHTDSNTTPPANNGTKTTTPVSSELTNSSEKSGATNGHTDSNTTPPANNGTKTTPPASPEPTNSPEKNGATNGHTDSNTTPSANNGTKTTTPTSSEQTNSSEPDTKA